MAPNIKVIIETINANKRTKNVQNVIHFVNTRKKVNIFFEAN